MMLSGLTSNGGRALGDGPGDHGRAGAAYLTGVHPKKTYGKDIQAGISMDQVAAQKLEGKTRFASLELGCEEGVQGGNCDNGYSCAYSNSISWRTPSSPMPPEIRPRAVFERLFGSADAERDPNAARGRSCYEKSVLDVVLDDARRLESIARRRRPAQARRVPVRHPRDRDAHPEDGAGQRARGPPAAAPPPERPHRLRRACAHHDGPAALAFQTDSTRVITLLLGIEQSPRSYGAEIGDQRSAPRPDAPQRRPGEDREGHADQLLPHRSSSPICSKAEVDPRKATARCSTIR